MPFHLVGFATMRASPCQTLGMLVFGLQIIQIASAASGSDFPIQGGTQTTNLCGICCKENRYCGKLSQAVVTQGLSTNVAIPAGTDMRCFLEDRSAAGAADQGRCVPIVDPPLSGTDLTQFCAKQIGSSTLSPTLYEASPQPLALACQSCCNGTRSCASGLSCFGSSSTSSGYCVPQNTASSQIASFCPGLQLQADKVLQCESCTTLTPAAQSLYNSITQINSLQRGPSSGP